MTRSPTKTSETTNDEASPESARGALKMSRSDRSDLAKLLRCAADQIDAPSNVAQHYAPLCDAAIALGPPADFRGVSDPGRIVKLAWIACADANDGFVLGCAPDRIACLLEAAQRVEDGEWPMSDEPATHRGKEQP